MTQFNPFAKSILANLIRKGWKVTQEHTEGIADSVATKNGITIIVSYKRDEVIFNGISQKMPTTKEEYLSLLEKADEI